MIRKNNAVFSSYLELEESLPERINNTKKVFVYLCRNHPFFNALSNEYSWGIVGGAVRDVLLRKNYDDLRLQDWKDIDVALTSTPKIGLLKFVSSKFPEAEIVQNHFGGVKLSFPDYGEIDLWVWHNNAEEVTRFWHQRLWGIDYGINAVAFIWPLKKVIIHPRWLHDMNNAEIEKLDRNPPIKELQPVRAVALATKLELKLNRQMAIGKLAHSDLVTFFNHAGEANIDRALAYLEDKVRKDRWPRVVISKLMSYSNKCNFPSTVANKIRHLAHQYS